MNFPVATDFDLELGNCFNCGGRLEFSAAEIGEKTVGKSSDDSICRCGDSRDKGEIFTRLSSFLRRNQVTERSIETQVNKSGCFRGSSHEIEEDDPFTGDDLPEEYNDKLSICNVLQWVFVIVLIAGFLFSLSLPYFTRIRVCELPLWKWELLVLVLICGRQISGWGICIGVFFIERNFFLRKRVLYFVYGVKKAVQNCLWLALVLFTWYCVFHEKDTIEVHHHIVLHYVTRILVSFTITMLIWLLKTTFIKVLALSFHVSTYFDCIQQALFNQHMIKLLSDPRVPKLGQLHECNLKERQTFKIFGPFTKKKDDSINVDQLHKMNRQNVSAWSMKKMISIVQHGVLSTLDEKVLHATDEDEASTDITTEYEAQCAAKHIFNNVAKPGSNVICPEDLMRFMKQDEALKTMSLFEGGKENLRIKKSALKDWVVKAFTERKALALTLNDTETAVCRLHHMLNHIIVMVISILWLLILGIAGTKLLVFITSQVLFFTFIFGNTCKTLFESVIFLFVMHPFNIGEQCEIDGVQMVVLEMNILTTVFLRPDNQKITYPNSVLSTKPISHS